MSSMTNGVFCHESTTTTLTTANVRSPSQSIGGMPNCPSTPVDHAVVDVEHDPPHQADGDGGEQQRHQQRGTEQPGAAELAVEHHGE